MADPAPSCEPFPLIELGGDIRERGLAYGRLAADRIHKGALHYREQLARDGFDEAGVEALVDELVPVMARFDAAYVEEMRFIAKGADAPFSTIALINARTEVLKLAQRARAARRARHETAPSIAVDDDPDGCTSVVLLPEATADRRLLHAQNWDWKVECAETSVVLSIARENGPDILTFTEAGGLARSGLNSAGLAITANYLESDRDYARIGVPLALIRRKALECAHLAHAIRAIQATEKSASNNIVLSHAEGLAFNFECAPDESFLVQPEAGLLVHANHWVSPIALGKLKDTGLATVPDSLYRDVRVRALLAPRLGRATALDLREALFDDFQSPWSVCRPPRKTLSDNLSATVAMIVMEPAAGVMNVAPLPALNRDFTTYRLPRPQAGAGHASRPAPRRAEQTHLKTA
jgi:isopenicillin-N N-acyltransferase-like protein